MSKPKCMMKGCKNERYKDKMFCEKHWKSRREKKYYKESMFNART